MTARAAHRRGPVTASLLGVVAALLTGCVISADGSAVPARPAVDAPIQWFACPPATPGKVAAPAGSQCGELSVPIDYDDPAAGAATLALIKVPATGQRIGSLVVNPGGPGASGVDYAKAQAAVLPPAVRAGFDLVGFDPRGVGLSYPALWCNSDADTDRQRAEPTVDNSADGVARTDADTEAYVQRCIDKTGTRFLASVNSVNVARDLDAIRAGLGEEKLTYLGYSYGTVIGAAYAHAFPQRVRALVLDGALDVDADPVAADLRQAETFQQAFDAFAADCARRADCPLGPGSDDPDTAVAGYRALVDPLVTRPAATADARGLSYNDAVSGTIQALYTPRYWTQLADGLAALRLGRGDALLTLADAINGRDAQGRYDNSVDVRVSVRCVDLPRITDRAVAVDQDRRLREAAPFLSYGVFSGNAPMATCAYWPVPRVPPPPATAPAGLPPVLVVSTTADPVTPYEVGARLAERLGARLLTDEGTQHTAVFQGEACIDGAVTRYLVDLTLPPPDTRCR